jgi:putative peptidoglycan lipid II flippase
MVFIQEQRKFANASCVEEPHLDFAEDRNYKRGVVSATLLLLVLTAFVRLTGFARELLVAFFLGANVHTDSYVFAFMLYDWATTVGLAVMVAALPLLAAERSQAVSPGYSYRVYSATVLIVFVPVVLVLIVLAGPLCHVLGGSSDSKELAHFAVLMSWTFLFVSYGNLQAAMLQIHERFLLQGLTGAVVNVVSILLLVLYHRTIGAYSLVIGIIGGLLVQIAIQGAGIKWGRWATGKYRMTRVEIREGLNFVKRFWGIAASQLALKGMLLVDRVLVLSLGSGLLSCLSYAVRLTQLPVAFIGIAASTALLPYQVQLMKESTEEYHAITDKALRVMFLAGTFMTVALFALSRPIVQVAYQRGAFTADDVSLTTNAMLSYAGTLAPAIVNMVLTNTLYCVGRTRLYLAISVFSLALYAVLAYTLVHLVGFTGIGWASTVVGVLYTLGVGGYLMWHGYLNFRRGIAGFVARTIFCSILSWGIMCLISRTVESLGSGAANIWWQVSFAIFVPVVAGCLGFYYIGTSILHIRELKLLVREVPAALRSWTQRKAQTIEVTPARELPCEP